MSNKVLRTMPGKYLICVSCYLLFSISFQFSRSVVSMDCSTPGFPVHHQLPELTYTHVRPVGDAIQPSHPLLPASPPAFNLSKHQGLFKWDSSSHQVANVSDFTSFSINHSNEHSDWFPWGWTGWISLQSKGLSRVFSNTTVQSINSSVLSFLYSSTLTSIQDYWKNYSFD